MMPSVKLQTTTNARLPTSTKAFQKHVETQEGETKGNPPTMLNFSRWQAMHTWCLVSGTQSLRAGGWSGGWNLAFFPWPRSRSLSELLEDGVCVGVLPGNTQQSNRSFTHASRIHQERGVAEQPTCRGRGRVHSPRGLRGRVLGRTLQQSFLKADYRV